MMPLWIKCAYTLFVCVLVPVYLRKHGAANFLWFSDLALLTTVATLWSESSLLASMMALGVTLPELAWNVGFFGRLIFGRDVTGLAGYMFDAERPLYLRGLSLFHVFLPVLLLWLVKRLGYDRRALLAQTLLMIAVLTVTYLATDPKQNINWAFGPGVKPQAWMPAPTYLALLMVSFFLIAYLPAHLLFLKLFS